MTITDYPGVCWPTQSQKEVLTLALHDNAAAELWHNTWRQRGISDLDRASQRLLPLIWYNLNRLEVEDQDSLAIAKREFHRTWYRNQLALRHLAGVMKPMQDLGLRPILVKGASLILTTYNSPALRPMTDWDILVPFEDAHKAIEFLLADWLPATRIPDERTIKYKNSQGFRAHESQYDLDLHWTLLPEGVGKRYDDDYWQRAVPAKLTADLDVLTLSPTDQLFHICVHGAKNDWGDTAPIWWIADAAWLIRKHPIDWELIIDLAVEQHLVVTMRYALRYLHEEMQLKIPSEIQRRLWAQDVTPREEREFLVKTVPHNYFRRLQIHWYSFRRAEENIHGAALLPGFLRYLQARWGVKGLRETVVFMAQNWLERIRNRK